MMARRWSPLRLPRAGRWAKRAPGAPPRRRGGPRLWSLEGLVGLWRVWFLYLEDRHKKIHGTQVSFGPEAHLYQELNSRLPFLSLHSLFLAY